MLNLNKVLKKMAFLFMYNVYTVFRAKSLLKLACKNLENIFNFVTSGGDSVIPYSFVSFLVFYLYLCFLGV